MASSFPPPGWYPDPAGGVAERWWDGQRWSARLRAATTGTLPPPPPRTQPQWPEPAHSWPAGPGPASPWSQESPTGRGGAAPDGAGLGGPEGEGRPRIPARAAWWALAGILTGEVLGSILGGLAAAATGSKVSGAVPTLFGELGLWAGMFGSCVLVSRRFGTGSLRRDFTLGFRRRDLLFGLGAGVVGVVVAEVIASLFLGTRLSGTNAQILTTEKGDGLGFATVTLIAALGAPFFEELFFRGLIRTALSARLGPVGAIWAQAALFGLAHFEPTNGLGNVSVIVAIGALGVVLGYTARRTGRLGAGMVAHGLFNLVTVVAILA